MAEVRSKSSMELRLDSKIKVADKSIETFFEKNVTSFGTGAKIDCPKEHLGKRAYVVIRKVK